MKDYDKGYFERGGLVGSNYDGYENTIKQLKIYYILVKSWLDKNINEKKRKNRILDIGCAYGLFLQFFDEIGWETYGLDISEYAINRAKNYTKAKLFVHSIENGLSMFSVNFFDVIVMFDVIEHLKNPVYVLEEIYRVLKPQGYLFMTTPNANSISRLLLKNKWPALRDKTHRILFTPYTLKFTLQRVGFEILEIMTPQFYPFSKFIQNRKIWQILRHIPGGASIWVVAQK